MSGRDRNGQGAESAGFLVEDDDGGGRRLVVTGRWSDAARDALLSGEADSLWLNYARGYSEADLEFLEDLPVRRLLIIDRKLGHLEPLSRLGELKELSLEVSRGATLDLQSLPTLRALAADWDVVEGSVVDAVWIGDLRLHGYPGRDIALLSHLIELRVLALVQPTRLEDLDGVGVFASLERLELSFARRLAHLDELTDAADSFRELDIQACRGFENIDSVAALRHLSWLGLNDCRTIASLHPLTGLAELEVIEAWGDTTVADGDLQPLLTLPRLRELRMSGRRHYTPTVREIEQRLQGSEDS